MLPAGLFDDSPDELVVVDTSNYYPQQRDGLIQEIENGGPERSWVEKNLGRPVAKAFNNIYAQHLRPQRYRLFRALARMLMRRSQKGHYETVVATSAQVGKGRRGSISTNVGQHGKILVVVLELGNFAHAHLGMCSQRGLVVAPNEQDPLSSR